MQRFLYNLPKYIYAKNIFHYLSVLLETINNGMKIAFIGIYIYIFIYFVIIKYLSLMFIDN